MLQALFQSRHVLLMDDLQLLTLFACLSLLLRAGAVLFSLRLRRADLVLLCKDVFFRELFGEKLGADTV